MIHKKLLSLLVLLMTTVSMSAKVPYMQISVTVPTGNSITLGVLPDYTINEVKSIIHDQTLIPSELQILTFNNQVLVDEQSVGYYDIEDDPTLTLSLVSGNYYLNGGSTQNCPVSFKVGNNENAGTAQEGDVVTVTFTPTAPYVLTAITAQAYTTWAGARRAEPEPTPTIPMLGDITLTPVEGQANTYTFTMPPSHVKFTTTLHQEYEVDLTVNGDDAQGTEKAKWTGKAGEQGTAKNFPIKAKTGQAVTISYNGRRKVKAVTATTDAEPVTLATPLTMEAITPGTIVVDINGTLSTGMKYSVNGGTPTLITTTTSIADLKAGDKVQFYGNGTQTQVYGNAEVRIQGSGDGFQTKVYGNIMSLLDETGFATKTELPNAEYVFYGLFHNNSTLTDASELLLPATTLAKGCYQEMFIGCTSLTTVPKLPAMTLAEACYQQMFEGSTSLTTAPKLPATTLAPSCYDCMFEGCTNLTAAPVLPATTLAAACYLSMFSGCTSLTAAPELPVTTLADACYWGMFNGCSNLTAAPELPATTLAPSCYNCMFEGCTNLTAAPVLPATTLQESCYNSMFYGCTSLTSAYVKAAYTGENDECTDMFYDCSAAGAVLHTTSDNKASWENMMGSGKEWPTWSVADDWQD